MIKQSIIYRHFWGTGRRTLMFVVAIIVLLSGLKSAEAEPITLSTVAALISLVSLGVEMFDSGTDPTAVAVLQTRTMVDQIHKRLNGYDTAISTLLAQLEDIRRQIRYDLRREFKNENLRELRSAMEEIVEYHKIYKKMPIPYGEGREAFSYLDRSVNRMMERGDLYVADYVIAMYAVLDTIYRSEMKENLKREKLDKTLDRYVTRLESVLDVNLETALAFKAQNLEIGLCKTAALYLQAKLAEEGRKNFAEQIQFFESIEYLLNYAEYALSQFKYGPLSSNPDQSLVLGEPELSEEDDYGTLIDKFFSLRYVYWCIEPNPAPILVINSR